MYIGGWMELRLGLGDMVPKIGGVCACVCAPRPLKCIIEGCGRSVNFLKSREKTICSSSQLWAGKNGKGIGKWADGR